jgi:exopolysaccharide biosynthesis polyprenyl glycosylphosphotransferase
MHDSSTNDLGRTVLLLDVLLTIITFVLSFWCRNFFYLDRELDVYSHLFLIPLLLVLLLGFLSYFGGYQRPYRITLAKYVWAIFKSITIAVGVLLALLFFLEIHYVSRLVMMIFAVAEFFVLFGVRSVVVLNYKNSSQSGEHVLRVIIIGTQSRARELTLELKKRILYGVNIVGYIDPDPNCKESDKGCTPFLGTVEHISECLKNNVVDEVIVAIPRSMLNDVEPIVIACEEEGITLRFMADVFDVQVARMSLGHVGRIPLLTMEPIAQDEGQLFAKRVFDFILTASVLPFLLPLFLLVAIAIKIDSPGPVFFIQQRVGLRKHLFPMYKFRSMYTDAEERLAEIEHLNEAEGPIFKMTKDPRVTRVGRFIRKASIDELPQLINVLKGDMSLVGPRPMSIRDVDLFEKGIQRRRFSVQPGITCLWQISGRSNLSFQRWLELDLEYIENWSFGLDLKILLKTIPAVLKSDGAA